MEIKLIKFGDAMVTNTCQVISKIKKPYFK